MSKNGKGIIAVLIVGALAFTAWKLFFKSKSEKVKYLIANNYSTGTPTELMAFGDDFIDAWYKAAKGGQNSFALNGTGYNVKGGKSL